MYNIYLRIKEENDENFRLTLKIIDGIYSWEGIEKPENHSFDHWDYRISFNERNNALNFVKKVFNRELTSAVKWVQDNV